MEASLNQANQPPASRHNLLPPPSLPHLVPAGSADIQTEQLDFLLALLHKEVSEHNITRKGMHHYMGAALEHERGWRVEQGRVKCLNQIIYDLRSKVQDETLKRMEAVTAKERLELEKELENDFEKEFVECFPPETTRKSPEAFAFDDEEEMFGSSPGSTGTKRKLSILGDVCEAESNRCKAKRV